MQPSIYSEIYLQYKNFQDVDLQWTLNKGLAGTGKFCPIKGNKIMPNA